MGAPPRDQDAKDQDHRVDGRSGRSAGYRVTPQSPNEALQPEVAPPPPPVPPSRRRPMLSAFSGFLSFLLIAAVAGMIGLVWSERRMREPGPLAADKVLYIVPGTDVPEIVSELEHEGIIDSPFAFNVALLVEGNRSKVKAGEYLFKQGASLRDVMDTLVSGKQILHAITIPEGLTSQQIVDRLREADVLIGDVRDMPKEGSLMPETYKVARGSSRSDLLKKMQDDHKKTVDQIWTRRANNLPLHSPYELVTLASIVEKETGKADERPHVASVFLNRLAKHMRLQSDPTIVYGLVGGKGTLGRGITRAELDKPTPYNTYAIDGLPPGPIANPGRAALEAVANPSRTQDLYFVADGTGGHVFAETLDQHSRNVQRWRQIEKDAKDKGVAGSDVDRSTPAPPAASPAGGNRSDQRTELFNQGSIYGALPAAIDATSARSATLAFQRSYDSGSSGQGLPAAAPWRAAELKPVDGRLGKGRPRKGEDAHAFASGAGAFAADAFAMGPGLDDLGISLGGARGKSQLDGPLSPSDAADAPDSGAGVSAETRFPVADRAPDRQTYAGANGEAGLAAAAADETGTPAQGRKPRPRIVDVSEGTALDPLRDKTYDLNFAKTVPSAKEMALPN